MEKNGSITTQGWSIDETLYPDRLSCAFLAGQIRSCLEEGDLDALYRLASDLDVLDQRVELHLAERPACPSS